MKVLIVYHKVDLDGVFSAAVAKMKYESKGYECVLYPWTYGDSMDGIEEKVAGDIDILTLVDLSFPDNERKLLEFNELCPSGVVWIDHHATSIEHYKDARIRGKREIGTAACELTWKFLFPNRDVPLLIQYLSAYDVWNKDRFEWDDVMAVQYAMRGRVGLNVKSAQNYLEYYKNESRELQLSFMDGLIKEGASILGYLSRKNKSECELYSFEAEFMGFKAICMNTLDFNSTTFESAWDPNKYDLMLPFAVKSNGKVRCSLYTTKPEINCGEIAKALGGGGHRQAAGFELDFDSEQFQSLMQNNKLI